MTSTGMNRRTWLALGALGLSAACGKKDSETSGDGKGTGKDKDKNGLPKDGLTVNELQIDYSIVLSGAGGKTKTVSEQYAFRNGDRFRFRFRPGFEAHVYILNRGPKQKDYSFLYPHKDIRQDNPVPAKGIIEIPGSGTDWMQLDKSSGTEQLVLIAASSPLEEFNVPARSIERDEFEERLGRVERDFRPASSRRVENGEWITLLAARRPEKTAMVMRLPLDHRA